MFRPTNGKLRKWNQSSFRNHILPAGLFWSRTSGFARKRVEVAPPFRLKPSPALGACLTAVEPLMNSPPRPEKVERTVGSSKLSYKLQTVWFVRITFGVSLISPEIVAPSSAEAIVARSRTPAEALTKNPLIVG